MKNWLWVAVAVVGCGSQMEAESPYVAPRVVTKVPSSLSVVQRPGRCSSPLRFSVTVDAMETATLRTKWVVDEREVFTTKASAPGESPRVIDQPSEDAFVATLGNLKLGTHTLSAYVTDGDFLEGFPVRAANGVVDEAVWVIDEQQCP